MTVANLNVPTSALSNADSYRQYQNTINETLGSSRPRYGAALPAIGSVPDGLLFSLTTTNKLYQARAGSWVLMT